MAIDKLMDRLEAFIDAVVLFLWAIVVCVVAAGAIIGIGYLAYRASGYLTP